MCIPGYATGKNESVNYNMLFEILHFILLHQ